MTNFYCPPHYNAMNTKPAARYVRNKQIDMATTFRNSPSNHLPQIVVHAISILLLIWMYAGGLVSYAPSVSSSDIQNIYLGRMLWYGIAVVSLQLIGIFLSLRAKTEYNLLLAEMSPSEDSSENKMQQSAR